MECYPSKDTIRHPPRRRDRLTYTYFSSCAIAPVGAATHDLYFHVTRPSWYLPLPVDITRGIGTLSVVVHPQEPLSDSSPVLKIRMLSHWFMIGMIGLVWVSASDWKRKAQQAIPTIRIGLCAILQGVDEIPTLNKMLVNILDGGTFQHHVSLCFDGWMLNQLSEMCRSV